VFDFTATGVLGGFIAFAAILLVFQFTCDRFLVDSGLVVLHLAFFARKVNVGVFSAWHVKLGYV
jgi:hypothetical protein